MDQHSEDPNGYRSCSQFEQYEQQQQQNITGVFYNLLVFRPKMEQQKLQTTYSH